MSKQQLNHSRKLDVYNEQYSARLEEERLHNIPTRKQVKYFRRLCAKMRENGIEPPTPVPTGRVGYSDAITEAQCLLQLVGVNCVYFDADVEHHIIRGEDRYSGDITHTYTVVRGGKIQKPTKVYNRNGLTRDERGVHHV